jgi:hypothetical protein
MPTHGGACPAQVAESEAVLACRLIARKTEPLDKMITRVQTARQEMRHLRDFDFGARPVLPCMHAPFIPSRSQPDP